MIEREGVSTEMETADGGVHPFWEMTENEPGDVACMRTLMANVGFIGSTDSSRWILVDAGVVGFGDAIVNVGQKRYGWKEPSAIILTHGHFDHVGSLPHLLKHWSCKVYAHSKELPYLTGRADYPPADPTVGGGLLASLSPLYPHGAVDLGDRVLPLHSDGTIPDFPEWRWIHTPGHTEGHISLYRQQDGCLIAGDAFITVAQESAWSVALQEQEVHGPPAYFTTDWSGAWESVKRLASLRPKYAITGHGLPMSGDALRLGLEHLAAHFDEVAIPKRGHYVH